MWGRWLGVSSRGPMMPRAPPTGPLPRSSSRRNQPSRPPPKPARGRESVQPQHAAAHTHTERRNDRPPERERRRAPSPPPPAALPPPSLAAPVQSSCSRSLPFSSSLAWRRRWASSCEWSWGAEIRGEIRGAAVMSRRTAKKGKKAMGDARNKAPATHTPFAACPSSEASGQPRSRAPSAGWRRRRFGCHKR